jgi:DUF4097 and DUF4098 domain-containing protein YvlB
MLAVSLVLLSGCGRFWGNRVYEEEIVSQTFVTSANPVVAVDLFQGSIRVVAQDKQEVEASVTKRAGAPSQEAARASLDDILVTCEQIEDTIKIIAERAPDADPSLSRELSASVELLKVPAGSSLILRTAFGAIAVESVQGQIEAATANGAISIEDSAGKVAVATEFGAVTIRGSSPEVRATTSNGGITLRQTAPTEAKLESSFGSIDIETDAGIDLTAGTANGSVRVKSAEPCTLELQTSFGGIEVEAAGADVRAKTNNGSIDARLTASGHLDLTSQFGSITVEGQDILLDAKTENGSIEFAGRLAAGDNRLRTHFGSLELKLPTDACLEVLARTLNGKIDSDFDIDESEPGATGFRRGFIGSDKESCDVKCELRTDNGIIKIKKS